MKFPQSLRQIKGASLCVKIERWNFLELPLSKASRAKDFIQLGDTL